MALDRAGDRREGRDAKYQLITTAQSGENGNITLEDGSEGVIQNRRGLSSFTKAYLVILHIVVVVLACLLLLPDRLRALRSSNGLFSDGPTWCKDPHAHEAT